jgi:hypothetical protein
MVAIWGELDPEFRVLCDRLLVAIIPSYLSRQVSLKSNLDLDNPL